MLDRKCPDIGTESPSLLLPYFVTACLTGDERTSVYYHQALKLCMPCLQVDGWRELVKACFVYSGGKLREHAYKLRLATPSAAHTAFVGFR